MVLFTSLHEYFCKCFFAVLRNDWFELYGSQCCIAINLQSNPERSHFLHCIDGPVHLDVRDSQPNKGDQNQEGHGLRAAFTTIPGTQGWAHPQDEGIS